MIKYKVTLSKTEHHHLMDIISKSEKETFDLAAKLASGLKGGEVFALFGDLGAGKTTFAKGVGKFLGLEKVIKSPTFNIVKIYPIIHEKIKYLVHIDAYRLSSLADAESTLLAETIGGRVEYVLRNIEMTIDEHSFIATVAWLQTNTGGEQLLLGREVVFDKFNIEFRQADEQIIFTWRGDS
jgi:tRNA threonylcarbamoyl adenosine modification protein YjeE